MGNFSVKNENSSYPFPNRKEKDLLEKLADGKTMKKEIKWKMSFEEYVEIMREKLQECFDNKVIEVQSNLKNNDQKLTGLSVRDIDADNELDSIAPLYYLNKSYHEGITMDEINDNVLNLVEKIKSEQKDTQNFIVEQAKKILDFNEVKDRVYMVLVNPEWNKERLERMPSRKFLDMSIIYKVMLDKDGRDNLTTNVGKHHLDYWGVTEEELFEYAYKNTVKLLGICFADMFDETNGLITDELGEVLADEFGDPMWVLTSETGYEGASLIVIRGVLEEVCKRLGQSEAYFIMSSIHEGIFFRNSAMDTATNKDVDGFEDFLIDMVTEVNELDMLTNNKLSNSAYHFSLLSGEIEVIYRKEGVKANEV